MRRMRSPGGEKLRNSVESGNALALPFHVVRAYLAVLPRLPALWRERRRMKRRLTSVQFRRLVRRYSIGPRQVAAL